MTEASDPVEEPAPAPGPNEPLYTPFPSFGAWRQANYPFDSFARYRGMLEDTKQQATPEVLAEALNTATRSAAVDTGAIEGLYAVDRGFTRTIAIEAAQWEAVLQARGEPVKRAIEDALRAYEYVLDAVTGQRGPMTETWIKQLLSTAREN